MTITCKWESLLGTVTDENGSTLTIYTGGNVPAIIYRDTETQDGINHCLVSFIVDRKHLENMLKDGVYFGWKDWELNAKYSKDAFMIAKLLTKYGYTVTLFNSEKGVN
jgi:hypothetical protein